MELYVFCLVCAMILGILVINGIYCFMYLSYPLPGGFEPCPPLSKFRRKSRRRPQLRTRSPLRSPARRSGSAAEVMIPMSHYEDEIDTRLQQTVESPSARAQLQQSTPRKKSGERGQRSPHRVASPRAGSSAGTSMAVTPSGEAAGTEVVTLTVITTTPSQSMRSVTPPQAGHLPRSVNVSAISITPPLARSSTPTRPHSNVAPPASSSRMKYGQTEI